MRYILLFIFIFPISIFSKDKMKFIFHCDTQEQAYACNDGCLIQPMVKEIKVNVEKSVVMVTSYFIKNLSKPILEPEFMENCAVIDEDNWKCTKNSGGYSSSQISKNGIVVFTPSLDGKGVCYKEVE